MGSNKLKYTEEELRKKLDEYFDQPMQFHSYPGMLLFLDISQDTEEIWRNNKGNKTPGHSELLKKAEERRHQELLDLGLNNRDKSVFAMFLLKQPTNGGLRDRPKDDDEVKDINITINGVDIGNAFK